MSSHHIVRDQQEPALVIEDITNIDQDTLYQLLEWSPMIICNQASYEKLAPLNIKVDRIYSNELVHCQTFTFQHPIIQNFLDEAIALLQKEGYTSANLIVSNAYPINNCIFVENGLTLVIFQKGMRYYRVKPPFKKWKRANELVTIIVDCPIGKVTGLKLIEHNIYETIQDGFFIVENESSLLIGEAYS